MAVHGIIVAAGTGTRLGGSTPKQLVDLGGRPILAWSLQTFVDSGVESLVVVANADHAEHTASVVRTVASHARVVAGGTTRAASVRAGLAAIESDEHDIVLVHDAARPLVTAQLVRSVIEATEAMGAATAAVPARDTLIRATGRMIESTVDRSVIHHVQTPQGFSASLLRRAHEVAVAAGDDDATDDAGLLTRHLGVEVAIVAGEDTNLKITTPADVVVARALLEARRTSEQT